MTDIDTTKMSASVKEAFNKQVAFFNIQQENAFFFCSPEEARHAMDSIREFREEGVQKKSDIIHLLKIKKELVKETKWILAPACNTVVSTGGSLSICALNQAIACIESHFPNPDEEEEDVMDVDIVIVHALRFADIRAWGEGCYYAADRTERKFGIVAYTINDTPVFLDNTIPPSIILLCSTGLYAKDKKLSLGKLEVTCDF